MINPQNIPPSSERKIAQVRQTLKQLKCEHPEYATRLLPLEGGGYIELCVDCMKILDFYEP